MIISNQRHNKDIRGEETIGISTKSWNSLNVDGDNWPSGLEEGM